MEEIQKLYNEMIEGLETAEDIILKMNDLLSVFILMVHKSLELQKDQDKRVLLIDSIKAMTNNMITRVSSTVAENEMKTIENEQKE